MNGWKKATLKEEKKWIEVKIKLPKNTMAFIVNYLEQCEDGSINMGNRQYDGEDVKKLKKGDEDDG